jgi:hypothetical protein
MSGHSNAFTPNKSIMLTAGQEKLWSNVVGGLFLNFGSIEFVLFRWIKHLDPSKSEADIFEETLAKKLKRIPELVKNSKIPVAEHQRVIDLWNEVGKTSREIRNPAAHNPWVFWKDAKGNPVYGIIDTQRSSGAGPHTVPLISIGQIHQASLRIAHLSHELTLFLTQAYP